MLMSRKKLPRSITDVVDGTKKLRCRTVSKNLKTGLKTQGDWFELSQEREVQKAIAELNIHFEEELLHWIEYE
jgi:hypothetical protein